jgi:ketosteroid isomerase-like protein
VMPAAREQVVREAWDAYNRGDIEATVAILDPEIVVHAPTDMANAGTYQGHDGFLTWIRQWEEAWDEFATTVTAVENVGERHVITVMHQTGIGRGSGVAVEMEAAWVFEIRDRLCTYMAIHPTLELARADARAREPSAAEVDE